MRILVVEDEADLNLLLCKVLTRAGYTVDGCMDGEEAELHLMGAEYDGILLDVMLPKKDGYTLVQELRAKGADTPVLFLTARDSVADRVRGLDLGGDDYLVKPFDFDELLARIRAMTRKHAGQRTNRFTAGDLVLDVEARRVTRGGEEIPLLPKEFSILEYLMRNKEKVVSREQIEDRIWNYEFTGSSNNVDGYMSRLRKKIDEGRPHRLIHTLRGVGWVLREPPEDGGGHTVKRMSVKVKITVWYVLLMALMAGLLLAFLLGISGSVSSQTAVNQLDAAVRANLTQVEVADDGSLRLGEGFQFYVNGVYTLVYSQGESLLAGQVPVSFTAQEPFQNGLTRAVDTAAGRYYVLDFWVPSGWDGGVWVRGLLEAPDNPQAITNLLLMAVVTMPLFILLAALGGYLIARRAFRPLEQLTATADAINEAADLSRRVEVPPGSNEFSRLAGTFNGMFARLERAFEAEAQFTADASHELRTPVSVIKSACEYAEKYGDTPEEQRETIAMIHRQADRMSALIGQLLSITRLDQGTEQAKLTRLNLSELVEQVCAEQPCPRERLLTEAEPGIFVQGDGALLTRLLQNLIDNGFKYGRPEGHVWVELRRGEDEVRLRVRDDGIGIEKEAQEKVWQRFFQAEPSRTGTSGAGLGLSMVQKIAQLHGGHMTLESVPGLGSAFTLHLPPEKK